MKWTNPLTMMLATGAIAFTGPAVADDDHDHGNGHSGDIEVGFDGQQLYLHDLVFEHHSRYAFHEYGGPFPGWTTRYDDDFWPGFDGHIGSAYHNEYIDFIADGPLYYWDGTGDAEFNPVSSGTWIEVHSSYDSNDGLLIDGSNTTQTFQQAARIHSSGNLHEHAYWELFSDNGDPAQGAYLVPFRVGSSHADLNTSELSGILFHYGLDHDQYHDALHAAEHLIPEPGSLALLGLGGALLLARRRARA